MRIFKASDLPRVVACNGSPALVEQSPKPAESSTDDAAEGTAFHEFAERLFKGQTVNVGDAAKNGFICNAEMLGYARDYVATFTAEQLTRRVEIRADWGVRGVFEVRNKSDLVIWNHVEQSLAVVDAKYGFRYVAPDNWQNIAGAIGAAIALGFAPVKFVLGIYQPRQDPNNPLRWVELTPNEMHERYQELVRILSTPSDTLQTGEHCRRCPAALGCPANRRATYNAVDVALSSTTLQQLQPEHMRNELDNLDRAAELIKQRRQMVEDAAKAALRTGTPVPGLSTKQQVGNTAWKPELDATAIRELGRKENVNYMDEEPCSPAEAKRRLKAAGRDPKDLDKHTHRPDRGFKLVKQDAADVAASVFGDAKPDKVKKARGKKAE